jgi:hypothetical protein
MTVFQQGDFGHWNLAVDVVNHVYRRLRQPTCVVSLDEEEHVGAGRRSCGWTMRGGPNENSFWYEFINPVIGIQEST